MTRLFILFCILITACNPKQDHSPSEELRIQNEGVSIACTDAGTGDTTLLFIHGWGINKTYWQNQVRYFSERYRVVTLDLPGFGNSGKNRVQWTVAEYAADVNAVIQELDLKNVVVLGHSMSGSIAVETALTNPHAVIAVVGIDNMKDIDLVLTPEVKVEWAGFYTAARQNFKKTVGPTLPYLYAPATDSVIKTRVNTDMLGADTTLAITVLENADQYPFVEKLQQVKKPVYLVNSLYMPADTMAFRKNNIAYVLVNIENTGHYPMIENAELFNSRLQQVLAAIHSRTFTK